MKQIRQGVFETNSSSTHSLTMVSKEEYEKFAAGELFFYDDVLVTKEAAIENAKKWYKKDDLTIEDLLEDGEVKTLDDIYEGEYETFKQEFTTKSGDVIVAFGYYGYNG